MTLWLVILFSVFFSSLRSGGEGEKGRSHNQTFRGEAKPLAAEFPRLRAYLVTYKANRESADLTLADFRRSDWGEEPGGLIAFHDYPDPGWPDVRKIVDDYAKRLG